MRCRVASSTVSSTSSSKCLPCRTSVTAVTPRRCSAPATAWPCGSRISGLGITSTTTLGTASSLRRCQSGPMQVTHFGHSCVLLDTGAARLADRPRDLLDGLRGRHGSRRRARHPPAPRPPRPRPPSRAAARQPRRAADRRRWHGGAAGRRGPRIRRAGRDRDDRRGAGRGAGRPARGDPPRHPADRQQRLPRRRHALAPRRRAGHGPRTASTCCSCRRRRRGRRSRRRSTYLRAVAPRTAVPIHQGILANPAVFYGHFDRLGPEKTTFRALDPGVAVSLNRELRVRPGELRGSPRRVAPPAW